MWASVNTSADFWEVRTQNLDQSESGQACLDGQQYDINLSSSKIFLCLFWFFSVPPDLTSAHLCALGGWPLRLHYWCSLALWVPVDFGLWEVVVEEEKEGEESGRGWGICHPSSLLPDCSFGWGCVPLTQSFLQFFLGFGSTIPLLCLTGPRGVTRATVAHPCMLHHSLPVFLTLSVACNTSLH